MLKHLEPAAMVLKQLSGTDVDRKTTIRQSLFDSYERPARPPVEMGRQFYMEGQWESDEHVDWFLYTQLWVRSSRVFWGMTPFTPKKEKGGLTPRPREPNPALFSILGDQAIQSGFRTTTALKWQSLDPVYELVSWIRKETELGLGKTIDQTASMAIVKAIKDTNTTHQAALPIEFFSSQTLEKERRSGRPFEHNYDDKEMEFYLWPLIQPVQLENRGRDMFISYSFIRRQLLLLFFDRDAFNFRDLQPGHLIEQMSCEYSSSSIPTAEDARIEQLEERIKLLESDHSQSNIQSDKRIQALEEENRVLNQILTERHSTIVESNEQNEALKRSIVDERRAGENRIRVQGDEIERLKLEISAQSRLANVVEEKDRALQNLEDTRDHVLQDLEAQNNELDRLKKDLEVQSNELGRLQRNLEVQSNEVSRLQKDLEVQSDEINNLQTKLEVRNEEVSRLQKERDEALGNLEARNNGLTREKDEAVDKLNNILEEAAYTERRQVEEIKRYKDEDAAMLQQLEQFLGMQSARNIKIDYDPIYIHFVTSSRRVETLHFRRENAEAVMHTIEKQLPETSFELFTENQKKVLQIKKGYLVECSKRVHAFWIVSLECMGDRLFDVSRGQKRIDTREDRREDIATEDIREVRQAKKR
jgi:hypothetical protein